MPSLKDTATYVRSKAAGPFWVTIDVFCGDAPSFERVRAAPALSARSIGEIYGVAATDVKVFEVPNLNVLKISFPRVHVQGSARDADSHAGQYFVPLLDLPVP